jgi:TM2 domain-containing membrane protein YozV
MTTPVMLPQMTEQQQATFNAYYPGTQRDELTGVLLALLLGSFGAHHFYLRRNALGVLYFLLCWTSVPFFLGIIEAFFMPERVRRFNAEQAALLGLLRGAGCDAATGTCTDGGLSGLRHGADGGRALLRAVRARDDVSHRPWSRLKARMASTIRLMTV